MFHFPYVLVNVSPARHGVSSLLMILAGWLAVPAPIAHASTPPALNESAASSSQRGQAAPDPASFDDLAARAAAARDQGLLEEALTLYRKALAVRPGWNEGRWYAATMLYELDRYADAKELFAEVLQREPAHAGALGLKGLCEFELRQYDAALVDLLQARKLGVGRSPGIATVVTYHASVLLTRAAEFEAANQMLVEFVADGTDTPQVLEAFGLNLLRVPMLPSEYPAADRERVLLAGRAGYAMAARYVEATRTALDELVKRYPNTPHVHYARGVFFLTEDSGQALQEFRRELEISPSHVPARLQIAFEYLKRGEAEQALPVAAEAAKLAPDDFAACLAFGQVLLETNDLDGAITQLERAATLAPGSPQAQFMLARGYTRAGRVTDAARARAEFNRLDQAVRAIRHGQQSVGGVPSPAPAIDRSP